MLFFVCAAAGQAGYGGQRMPQDVYVWQRSWNEPVVAAVRAHGTNFSEVVVLCAEVTWQAGQPKVARVPVNWDALNHIGAIGLALRIGPFAGPFDRADERALGLARLAASITAEATTHQLLIGELQIDFDCAESKLEGYSEWVAAIRRQLAPTCVVITALPSWLKQPDFRTLIRSCDGYVLQVHSLERPATSNAVKICDPELARRAVAQAGRLGAPFRVALPTYGYVVAFDSKGKFAGLSAEGPPRNWAPGTKLQEARSDSAALAELVRGWGLERPQLMRGIIWYRLPVEGDALNWSWPTLSKVMTGQTPHARLRSEARRAEPGLIEFDLVNEGDADFAGKPELQASWSGVEPVASDGMRGFEPRVTGTNMLCFRNQQPSRIRPQERQMVGWLRLSADASVDVRIRETTDDQNN